MKNLFKVILLLFTICLCSCGPVHKDDSSEPLKVTIYYRDDSSSITDSSINSDDSSKVTTKSTVSEKEKVKEAKITNKVQEVQSPLKVTKETTTTTTTTFKQPEFVVFKPSTHYIHRSTCKWVDDSCYKIEDTKGIQARYCNDCNPDMEIIDPYVVVTTTQVTTTTTSSTTAAPQTTTKKTTTTTTTTTVPPQEKEIEEEIVESGTYRLPYILSESEWIDICKVVSSETGYCGEKQQKAVANTIFNRIIWANQYGNLNPYPKDVYSILRQKNQYNAIYHWKWRVSKDSRLGYGGSLWNQTMKYIKEAAYESDFTNGAIGYYNPAMSGYLSAFENNKALLLAYVDGTGRFFKLNPACYTRK